jgi:quaternary ammonium compound-resistance protein SugE
MQIAGPRPWLSLILAAAFQVIWIVSLKMMGGLGRFVPILAYALSGLGVAVFLSLSMKTIPMATAFAVWMGLSLVGALLVDAVFFREPWNLLRIASAAMIIAGSCGLRMSCAP